MAGDPVHGRVENHPESASEKLREQFNKLIDDVETLRGHVAAGTTNVVEGDLEAGKVERK